MAEDSTQPPHATRFVETPRTTMEADPTKAYNQDDATGFIRLNCLRLKVAAKVHGKKK